MLNDSYISYYDEWESLDTSAEFNEEKVTYGKTFRHKPIIVTIASSQNYRSRVISQDIHTALEVYGKPTLKTTWKTRADSACETRMGYRLWNTSILVADYVSTIAVETSFTLRLLGVQVSDPVSLYLQCTAGLRGQSWQLQKSPQSIVLWEYDQAVQVSSRQLAQTYSAFFEDDASIGGETNQVWNTALMLVGKIISIDARIKVICSVDVFNSGSATIPKSYIDYVRPFISVTASLGQVFENAYWESSVSSTPQDMGMIAVLPGSPYESDYSWISSDSE